MTGSKQQVVMHKITDNDLNLDFCFVSILRQLNQANWFVSWSILIVNNLSLFGFL
jgi:hypothetical protein